MKVSLTVVAALVCLSFVTAGQAQPRLELVEGSVHVSGVGSRISEEGLNKILAVYTNEAFTKNIDQPVAGTYITTNDGIIFTPSFPFAPGASYHAVYSKQVLTFQIPAKNFPLTSIESMYPRSTVVPENLLRIYISFSAPMMPGEAYDHIKLFNDEGEQVGRAFLVVDQELWDVERKRLTILFDPGRIKRGLKANLDMGAPLEEGGSYVLTIDSTWRDINGNTLQGGFKKRLSVVPAQRSKLTLRNLTMNASAEALTIHFDRAMDHALVTKYISVWNSSSSGNVTGTFGLEADDRTLKFIPDHPLHAGNYKLKMSPLLEDVAGNNFNNAFDLDMSKESRITSNELLTVDFVIPHP